MIFDKPTAKPHQTPPPLPVLFKCWVCGVEQRFTRDELDASSALAMAGAVVWTRPCQCGDTLRRVTRPAQLP
jgi:hypothetical protein